MPTMADVAARATVSSALSGDAERIRAPVLRRVVEAAQDLEDILDDMAGSLTLDVAP